MLLTAIWTIQLIFMPPLFPNGGFAVSKPFASQQECEQAKNQMGLVPGPSQEPICVMSEAPK